MTASDGSKQERPGTDVPGLLLCVSFLPVSSLVPTSGLLVFFAPLTLQVRARLSCSACKHSAPKCARPCAWHSPSSSLRCPVYRCLPSTPHCSPTPPPHP